MAIAPWRFDFVVDLIVIGGFTGGKTVLLSILHVRPAPTSSRGKGPGTNPLQKKPFLRGSHGCLKADPSGGNAECQGQHADKFFRHFQ
eukprot:g12707.t1